MSQYDSKKHQQMGLNTISVNQDRAMLRNDQQQRMTVYRSKLTDEASLRRQKLVLFQQEYLV